MGATGWLDGFRDREDNYVVISNGELVADFPQEWHNDVISGIESPGRVGEYTAQQVLGGEDIDAAAVCVWSHAAWGDQDIQSWNTSTTGPDNDGPGVCRLLFGGGANFELNGGVSHSLSAAVTPGDFVSDAAVATTRLASRVLYVRPVLTNTGPLGFLSFDADPIADGVPPAFADTAEVEYESDDVDLVKVELTGDAPVRGESDPGEGIRVALRDAIQPNKSATVWGTWQKGVSGEWNFERDGRIEFDYAGESTVTWTEVTGLVAGATGWDNIQADYDEQPDEVITFGTKSSMSGDMPELETTYIPDMDVAVRITVRSPRYRWVWEGGGITPPRRGWPSNPGFTTPSNGWGRRAGLNNSPRGWGAIT